MPLHAMLQCTLFIKMGHHQSHSTKVDVDILQRARASVVCGLLQPDCRLHRSLWHSGTINRPMPHSSILPCVPTTDSVGCPFLPSVPLTSDSGTCRMVYSSTGPDKLEAAVVATASELCVLTLSVSVVSVSGVDLLVADERL